MHSLSTARSVARQQHFELLGTVDQELLEAGGQHMLCVPIAVAP